MGYDFMFLSIGPRDAYNFPLPFGGAPAGGPVDLPWPILRGRVLARGARPNGGPDILWLEAEPQQSICFFGGLQAVALDVHADWNHVLSLYQEFLQDEPDLLIFDPQRGCFHDATSFRQFMVERGHLPGVQGVLSWTVAASRPEGRRRGLMIAWGNAPGRGHKTPSPEGATHPDGERR